MQSAVCSLQYAYALRSLTSQCVSMQFILLPFFPPLFSWGLLSVPYHITEFRSRELVSIHLAFMNRKQLPTHEPLNLTFKLHIASIFVSKCILHAWLVKVKETKNIQNNIQMFMIENSLPEEIIGVVAMASTSS